MSVIKHLGIDEEDLRWYHLAACKDMPLEWFFEDYESDTELAKQVDNICIGCPVIKYCHDDAAQYKTIGVRAGVYYNLGKVDKKFNQHKTPEIWRKLKKLHG